MYDVAVIGSGVVGAMTARVLSGYALTVCILEKEDDVAMGASCANSAIVHAGFDAMPGSLKAKLNVRGSEMMERTAQELGVKYRRNGSLVIGFRAEDRRRIEELLERGRRNGVPGLEIVEGDALHRLEPSLSAEVLCALYAPTGAIVCPYELTVAAVGNAMDNGAELKLNFTVTDIAWEEDHYLISSPGETLAARFVVNAAGLYADRIAAMAGDDSFAIHPRRGEYLLLDKDCGGLVSHTIFRTPTKMGKGILVTPTVDGNLLLGPTSQDGTDKEDKQTTAAGIAQILKEAAEDVNALPTGRAITSFCGLRAVGDSGDFILTAPRPGFVNAAGIESPGLSASPAIAEYIVEMLAEQGLPLKKKADHDSTRRPTHAFREASIEEKNRIIQRDPRFGRVVCRCETVTEGEIVEAIHVNPPARNLDAVKRRTRAQMGRCQGGFCMPFVAEILSRELGIPYEQVTKNGAGSYINIGRTKEVD